MRALGCLVMFALVGRGSVWLAGLCERGCGGEQDEGGVVVV